MKIGIIGIGSIGQRHVRSLKQLGFNNIIALRTKKGTIKNLPPELNYVKEILSESDFYNSNPNGIIVSNPTALHIKTIKVPLKKNIPVFIEKPIASSLEDLNELKEYDTSRVMVGFCLRYHEIINFIKNYIESGQLGEILKANLYSGQYLPFWHRYADYRTEYYSKKELGGGVLRTLSHEIDIMHYLFGPVKELIGSVDKISKLEIDVDDNVNLICRTHKKTLVSIELDYLNPISTREGRIFGTNGVIEYSFLNNSIILKDYNETTHILHENSNYDPNNMYIDQMKDFIKLLEGKKNIRCNFKDGVEVMKVIKAAEDSAKENLWKTIGND